MAQLSDAMLRGIDLPPWVTAAPSLRKDKTFNESYALARASQAVQRSLMYDPIIDVSNVADYVWDQKETWSTTDREQFPCLTPPFPSFFMEYRRPPFFTHERDDLHTEEGRKKFADERIGRSNWVRASTNGWPIARYGVMFDSIDRAAGQTLDDFDVPLEAWETGKTMEDYIHPDSRWVLRGSLFIWRDGQKRPEGPVAFWFGGLNEHGLLMQDARIGMPGTPGLHPEEKFYWQTLLTPTFQPALRAISYMHCKNISQQEHTPPPKLSKAYAKKNGRPLLRYRTLVIEPLTAGKGMGHGGGGGAKSHHFVRGHFADYREKGLFGKESLKRIFWIDVHTRGSKEIGEVLGDYEVDAPQGKAG